MFLMAEDKPGQGFFDLHVYSSTLFKEWYGNFNTLKRWLSCWYQTDFSSGNSGIMLKHFATLSYDVATISMTHEVASLAHVFACR